MPGMPYKIKSIVTRKLEGVNHFHYYLFRQLKGGGMEITMNVLLMARIIAKTGVGNHVKQLSEELANQGHRVWVVASTNDMGIGNNAVVRGLSGGGGNI